MLEVPDVIQTRCAEAGLEFETREGEDGEIRSWIIDIPDARGSRKVVVRNRDFAQGIISTRFEHYRFIKGYEEVWSIADDVIECEITLGLTGPTSRIVMRTLQRLTDPEVDPLRGWDDLPDRVRLSVDGAEPAVSVGIASPELSVLTGLQLEGRMPYPNFDSLRRRTTIRIEKAGATNHDQARAILIKYANAYLFKLDLLSEWPIHLQTQRLRRHRRQRTEGNVWSPAEYEYDEEPMSLYWYGRTALEMPLLQFLAYYQVLEYYFPIYSYGDAKRTVRNILRNPTFNKESESDITRLLQAIKVTARGKAFGDEKEQLKSTVIGSVVDDDLRSFMEADPERKEFFGHSGARGLSKVNIPLGDTDQDLRPHVASRIYQIRCRVVHTKSEDRESELLLPFSPDIRKLTHDLELVEFLARNVLVANSRPLS